MGEINLWTTEIVIVEMVWTLKSFYKFTPQNIFEAISNLLSLKGLSLDRKNLILDALKIYSQKSIDFVDIYNYLVCQEEGKPILSFDEDFDKLGQRENLKNL